MNLMNCSVKHIYWGIGMVTEQKDNYIKIIFGVGEKQFVYPDAFEKFLKCEDTNMQSQIEEELALKKQQEIQKQQERQQRIEEISRTVPVVNTRNGKKEKLSERKHRFQMQLLRWRKRPKWYRIFMCLQ